MSVESLNKAASSFISHSKSTRLNFTNSTLGKSTDDKLNLMSFLLGHYLNLSEKLIEFKQSNEQNGHNFDPVWFQSFKINVNEIEELLTMKKILIIKSLTEFANVSPNNNAELIIDLKKTKPPHDSSADVWKEETTSPDLSMNSEETKKLFSFHPELFFSWNELNKLNVLNLIFRVKSLPDLYNFFDIKKVIYLEFFSLIEAEITLY